MHQMQLKNNMDLLVLFIIFLGSNALLCTTQSNSHSRNISFPVGVVLDLDSPGGRIGLSYLSMALSDFYRVHKNYTTKLVLHVEDSKGLVIDSAALALKLLKDVRVDAIIGPQKSTQASFLMDLGNRAHVPIISFSATSPSLLPRTPYFIQTAQSDDTQVGAIAAIVKVFQWREAVVIFEDTDYGRGMIPYLANALHDIDVQISYRSVIPLQATDDFILKELYKMMTMQTRIFVVQMSHSLASRLFLRAQEAGMMSEGYAWIVSSGVMDMLSSMDSHVVESMQGVLGVKPRIPETEKFVSFLRRWRKNFFQNDPRIKQPEVSILGLWAYDTLWALAMAVERVGLRESDASNNGTTINSTNLFNLEISPIGPKVLKEILRTRFEGLSGEFFLLNGKSRTSSFQILNVVGKEGRKVGIWTQSLGLSREFKRNVTTTYSGSKENLWGIIWPGESTDVPRGWEVQIRGKKLKIGVPVKDGFTDFVSVERDLQTNSAKGSDGSYNDFVHQVFLQKFDAAVGDIAITANRSLYVDFTLPIAEGGVSMIVPITYEDINDKWTFLKPLKKDLWLTSIACFILTGFAVWVLEHRINTAFRGPPSQHVGMICWFPFSTLVFAHREKILSNFARLVVVVWIFVVLVLSSTYTASLSSRLTVQRLRPSYTDVEALVKNGNYVGHQEGSFIADLLKGLGFEESKLKPFKFADECSEALSKGSKNGGISAFFDVAPHTKLFLSKYCNKYMAVGPTYRTDGFAFVFQKGSPLVADVSRAILSVTEGKKMFAIDPTCADPESTMTSNSVTLNSFEGLFAITGSVTATCLLVFFIFFLCKNKHLLQRIIANSSSTTWSRFCAVCRHFDQRDLSSYPFSRSRDTTQDDKFQQLHNININTAAAAAAASFSSSHSSADSLTSASHLPDVDVDVDVEDGNHGVIQPNVVVVV